MKAFSGALRRALHLAAVLVALGGGPVLARALPPGFVVWPSSISPDGRLGVIVPDDEHAKDGVRQNALVEVATGQVVAAIDAETVVRDQSHVDLAPRWSTDGSTLVWHADGKWGSLVDVVLRLERGRVRWQTNVRELAVQRLLHEVRAAAPKTAATIKERNKGWGSWYRDGLTVDVRARLDAARPFPLRIRMRVASDPKGDDAAGTVELEGTMSAVLGADGTMTYSKLVLSRAE